VLGSFSTDNTGNNLSTENKNTGMNNKEAEEAKRKLS
jgi:hypothetical protein